MKQSHKRDRVAYIMSRFPKLTETFVLDEMIAMSERFQVEVFPLWRHHEPVTHGESERFVKDAHYLPTLSASILQDNIWWLIRSPRNYVSALLLTLWFNAKSLRYLIASIAIFPKVCSFARTMRKQNIRHVHAHFASHPALAGWIIERLTKIPWSFTAHGSDLHRNQAMLAQKLSSCRFAITISNFNHKFMREHTSATLANKIRVIRCGVVTSEYSKSQNLSEVLSIVCIGTLHEVKGQKYLLEACAKLEDRNWHCHLVGEGRDRKTLTAITTKLGIENQVTFHGALRKERVKTLLSNADVLCAPSVPTRDGRREGIPVVLIEGAAVGLPLVASDLSGIPEIVIDGLTGLLTEPKNPHNIANALEKLQRQSELRELYGRQAKLEVERRFNLKTNVDALANLIEVQSRC